MNQKIPLYTPTKSLDVAYHFVHNEKENASATVFANDIHAVLNTACNDFLQVRSEQYKSSVGNINFATAAVTFLYTDTSTEEGYLGEDIHQKIFALNISDKNARIHSSIDFYTQGYHQSNVDQKKDSRCSVFNHYLSKRVEAFSLISANYHIPQKSKPAINSNDLNKIIAGQMFHETFHHTEQSMMHYLNSPSGIKSLVKSALSLNASYVYGIVLDLYSQRMVCGNCNIGFLGMQNSYSNNGFVYDFNQALIAKGIEHRINGKTMVNTRVSVSKSCKGGTLDPLKLPLDSGVVHTYDANQDNKVYQALGTNLNLSKIKHEKKLSIKSYTGGFFTSSKLSKEKLEKAIALKVKDVEQSVLSNKMN